MVENIYELKNRILERVESDINEQGIDRFDVAEVGKMVDMVKDLAVAEEKCWEADYYRNISESMSGKASGYPEQDIHSVRSEYNRSAGTESNRRGYGRYNNMSGHQDTVQSLKQAMMSMSQDERERTRQQLRGLLEGSM